MLGQRTLVPVAALLTALHVSARVGDLVITDADDASDAGLITEVKGDLIIAGTDLRSVWSLLALERVGGNLTIRDNPRLESLDWLQSLEFVGGRIVIAGNGALVSVDGLGNLTSAMSLEISENAALLRAEGFPHLTYIRCAISFEGNAKLERVDGFNKLDGVRNQDSDRLAHECRQVGVEGPMIVFRSNDALAFVGGFESVKNHAFQINGNRALAEIKAFEHVRIVSGGLEVVGNPALLAFPFPAVRQISGYCRVSGNSALKDLVLDARSIDGARFLLNGGKASHALDITNNSGLERIVIRQTRLMDGNVVIAGNGNVASIESHKTITIGGYLIIDHNAKLRNISLKVISVGGMFSVSFNPSLQNLMVAPLWSVMHQFLISDNDALETVSTALGNMKGELNVHSNPKLVQLNMDSLAVVWGNLLVNASSPSVWSGFPLLKFVGGNLHLSGPDRPGIVKQSPEPLFPHLWTVGGDFTINNGCVTSLTGFNNVSIVKGSLFVVNNQHLSSILGFNNLREVRGRLMILMNPLLDQVGGFAKLDNVGQVQIVGNPLLNHVEGLYQLRSNCSIWGTPDEFFLKCEIRPANVICICFVAIALFAASFLMTATCKTKWPIAEITRSGTRLFIRTKKPHSLHTRDGRSFCVRLAGTGCGLLDKPTVMLRAKVIGSAELELIGLSIERLMEEARLERAAALGVVSVRARDEFRLMGWPLPILYWLLLLLLTWFVSSFVVTLSTVNYLRVCGLAIALGVLPPWLWRMVRSLRIKQRMHQKHLALKEAELMQRLETAGWDDDQEAKEAISEELVRSGWQQERFDEHWQEMLVRQSQEAGVSVAYLLSDEFRLLAQERSGKENPTFYDLKDSFFLCDEPLGRDGVCPRDGQKGVALVDWLPRGYRRACTHFLSWTWGYTLHQVCGALEQWLEQTGLDADKTFIYMCFFVNNQHRILIAGTSSGSDNLETVFESNLRRIGKMVALLDDWNEPLYFSRIWTVFEQFTAVKLGIEVEIIIPPAACKTLVKEIHKGERGIVRLKQSLCNVDSKHAKAWSEQDEQKVKNAILDTIGFEAVNRKLCQFMVAWIARQVQSHLTALVLSDVSQRDLHSNSMSFASTNDPNGENSTEVSSN